MGAEIIKICYLCDKPVNKLACTRKHCEWIRIFIHSVNSEHQIFYSKNYFVWRKVKT